MGIILLIFWNAFLEKRLVFFIQITFVPKDSIDKSFGSGDGSVPNKVKFAACNTVGDGL